MSMASRSSHREVRHVGRQGLYNVIEATAMTANSESLLTARQWAQQYSSSLLILQKPYEKLQYYPHFHR